MLFYNISKNAVISELNGKAQALEFENTTKAKTLYNFISLVNACNISNYKNIKTNGSNRESGLNIGDIGENIVLNYLGLKRENLMNEVKTFIIDTPNKLTNVNVKIVYILVCFDNFNGLYKVNASELLNIRIGKKYLMNCKTLEKVCELYELIK